MNVTLIESWGSDERIIEAARMSTQKGFRYWGTRCVQCGSRSQEGECTNAVSDYPSHVMRPGDEGLLAYLWNNRHTSPFEMAGAVFEVHAPIFVLRQWMRHRTMSFNEMSARYTQLPNKDYVPTVERVLADGGSNKQASGTRKCTREDAERFIEIAIEMHTESQKAYEWSLSAGVPRELARTLLPVARYSAMRVSANLLNWLRFLSLRDDSHAQAEIVVCARMVREELTKLHPRTMAIFEGAGF